MDWPERSKSLKSLSRKGEIFEDAAVAAIFLSARLPSLLEDNNQWYCRCIVGSRLTQLSALSILVLASRIIYRCSPVNRLLASGYVDLQCLCTFSKHRLHSFPCSSNRSMGPCSWTLEEAGYNQCLRACLPRRRLTDKSFDFDAPCNRGHLPDRNRQKLGPWTLRPLWCCGDRHMAFCRRLDAQLHVKPLGRLGETYSSRAFRLCACTLCNVVLIRAPLDLCQQITPASPPCKVSTTCPCTNQWHFLSVTVDKLGCDTIMGTKYVIWIQIKVLSNHICQDLSLGLKRITTELLTRNSMLL